MVLNPGRKKRRLKIKQNRMKPRNSVDHDAIIMKKESILKDEPVIKKSSTKKSTVKKSAVKKPIAKKITAKKPAIKKT